MNENNQLTQQQSVQYARLQAWAMSVICTLLIVCVMAAATRVPYYLAMSDYIRLTAFTLFALVVLMGVIANMHTHICLWQIGYETNS